MDDREIVDLFFARSENAIAQVKTKYEKTALHVARNILHNDEDSEECVNDALLSLWNTIPPQKPDRLLSFFCGIVRNLSLKRYRANAASGNVQPLEELADVLPSDHDLDEAITSKRIRGLIESWLKRQRRDNRYIFIRKFWYFDSVTDIAAALSMPERTVYHRLVCMKDDLYAFLVKNDVFS